MRAAGGDHPAGVEQQRFVGRRDQTEDQAQGVVQGGCGGRHVQRGASLQFDPGSEVSAEDMPFRREIGSIASRRLETEPADGALDGTQKGRVAPGNQRFEG
jgi:hypothetical protein